MSQITEQFYREALAYGEWREMPSDPPTPAQWNLHGWMAAYHEAARRGNPPPTPPSPVEVVMKKDLKEEPMQGGWKFEGKEKPVIPRICTKCQGPHQSDPLEEPDRDNWCEACKEGKLLGHSPERDQQLINGLEG